MCLVDGFVRGDDADDLFVSPLGDSAIAGRGWDIVRVDWSGHVKGYETRKPSPEVSVTPSARDVDVYTAYT